MNTLSWFLYMADVLPFFSTSVLLLSVFVLTVGMGALIAWNWSYKTDPDETLNPKLGNRFMGIFFVVVVLALLIPSKETIYLIAGSEAGEYVVNTPEAKEIMSDIHTIIKQQIKGATSD